MKKTNLLIVLILFFGSSLFAQTWDILDKSMATYNQNDGASNNQAWGIAQGGSAGSVVTQQAGYVNFTKTNTGASARWAWVRPEAALANITAGTAYSIEVKARVHAIGIADEGSYFEANQIALRLGSKQTAAPIYLKYGDGVTGGYVSTTSGGTDAYPLNTSEWQVYRLVFHADHLKYDVYIDGVETAVFENVGIANTGDQNGIYFGAESYHRCNIDVEYVKMGTGDFFSVPRISSINLSHDSHISGNESTVSVTVNTALIGNDEKLLISLVDEADAVIVAPVEATVANNVATANIVIPSSVAEGEYAVKVAAKGQISGTNVAPKKALYEIKDISSQTWDILNRDFSVKAWNASPAWSLEKGGSVPASFVTQQAGYVNITKTQAYGSFYYAFLTSPAVNISPNTAYTFEVKARAHEIDKNEFPDGPKPSTSEAGGYEANQIGFQLNNKFMSIYLIYGDENTGYVASPIVDGTGVSPSYTSRHKLNTSEWHVYRLIFNADNTKYDIYVDGELIFENVPLFNKSGSNVAKIGGESWQRCNMDVEYAKMGTGDLVTGDNPKLLSIELSSDSHVANNARTIQVTANTSNIANGEKLQVSFTAEDGVENVINPVEITINSNKGTSSLTIPATVALGKYTIKVASPNGKIDDQTLEPKSMQYVVVDVSPLETKMLPQVKPVGFVKEMADYIYTGPSKEFIFPSIVDTKKYTENGKFKNGDAPIDRYYLFYAPHENPGGMFLSTAPTLDGPWTEYPGTTGMTPGTVMDFAWAATQSDIIKNGAEKHISGCQVVWNEVQNKYIMYFHGPNSATHYATSENLVNWTFGETILLSHQFSPIGAEASYAKAFKHEIPGLDNKYVLLLMNQENQIRRIYWAHSKDGINWTPVTKPLISPDLNYKKVPGTDRKPSYDGGGTGAYGNNISGPFLMEKDGRYFVICHGCADNLMVVEVGRSFDMEIHWGEYMKATDVIFNVNGKPTVTRPAAPDFIQDDNGKWYMFFEAGGRLGANIGYAKETDGSGVKEVINTESVSISGTVLNAGQALSIESITEGVSLSEVALYSLTGNEICRKSVSCNKFSIYAPAAPGMYMLNVRLNNNTSKEFKIIIK